VPEGFDDNNDVEKDAVSGITAVTDTDADDITEGHVMDTAVTADEATELDSVNDAEEDLPGSCTERAPDTGATCTAD